METGPSDNGPSDSARPSGGGDSIYSHSITMLIDQLQSDDRAEFQEAARKIWSRYLDALLNMARQHLPPAIRKRADEEDVVQSVFATFCLRHREKGFALNNRDDLWRLLVAITENKAINLRIHHTRQRRDVRRELGSASSDSMSSPLEKLEYPEPTPDDAAVLVEQLRVRLDRLDEPLRRVAIWKLQGYTNNEIADAGMMNCAVRTVERKLNLIRQMWRDDSTEAAP